MDIARYLAFCALAAFALALSTESYATLNIMVLTKVSDLQTATTSYPPDTQITIGGYYNAADQGGGLFVAGGVGSCQTASFSGSTTAGSPTISYSGLIGTLANGMGIAGPALSTYLPKGDTIVAYDSLAHTVTLAVPALNNSGGTVSFTLSSDNGGSQLCDSNPSSSGGTTLYTRIHSNFGPKEWGAIAGGSIPIQVALHEIRDGKCLSRCARPVLPDNFGEIHSTSRI